MDRQTAEERCIIRSVVGSTVLGLNIEGSDRDEMGVLIEPIDEAMGVGNPFEQWSDGNNTFYGLRKWCRLALKGNPTVMALLWVPPVLEKDGGTMISCDALGYSLRKLAPCFVSRGAGRAFLGYLQAQRDRLSGERGHGRHGAPRVELVEKYGYDTKYAMHMLRLGMQGVELLTSGRIAYPMLPKDREYLLGVREGTVPFNDTLTRAGELEAEMKDLMNGGSPLPEEPDVEPVQKFMLNCYQRMWSAERKILDIREDYEAFKRDESEANFEVYQ